MANNNFVDDWEDVDDWQDIGTTPTTSKPAMKGNAAQAALEGFGQTATMGYLPHAQAGVERGIDKLAQWLSVGPSAVDDQLREQGFSVPEQSYVQSRDQNIARQNALDKAHPTASMAGKAAGIGATMLVPGMAGTKAASLTSTALRGAGTGAVQGALYNPGDTEGVLDPIQAEARAKNAALGAGTGLIAGGISKGLEKGADRLMQRAVGRKKYTPGVGTELAERGVVGTKGMMRKQVGKKLTQTGEEISGLVDDISGSIDSAPIAKQVASEADSFIPTSGAPSPIDAPKIQKITEVSDDIASRGSISPREALERRVIAGKRAFRKDDPLESLIGRASKKEQAGYSQALKDAYAKSHPSTPTKLADADKSYGALARANRSLNEEETFARSLMGLLAKTGVGATGGYIVGGPEGAAIGAALGSPAGMSMLGQAAAKSAPAVSRSTIPLIQAILEGKREE